MLMPWPLLWLGIFLEMNPPLNKTHLLLSSSLSKPTARGSEITVLLGVCCLALSFGNSTYVSVDCLLSNGERSSSRSAESASLEMILKHDFGDFPIFFVSFLLLRLCSLRKILCLQLVGRNFCLSSIFFFFSHVLIRLRPS